MKNLIVGIVFWWASLKHRSIAKFLWFVFWLITTLDLAWFVHQIKPGDGIKFIVALVVYFLLADVVFGIISLLHGDKKYRFFLGVFTKEVEEGWMNQAI